MLPEEAGLTLFVKDKDYFVTTGASKIGLGITLWQKQLDGEVKPIAFDFRMIPKNITQSENKSY